MQVETNSDFAGVEQKTNSMNSCRACLEYFNDAENNLISIFNKVCNENDGGVSNDFVVYDAFQKINIKFSKNDALPKYICHGCLKTLKDAHNFHQLCSNSKKKYMKHLRQKCLNKSKSLDIKECGNEMDQTNVVENADRFPVCDETILKIEDLVVQRKESILEEYVGFSEIKEEEFEEELDLIEHNKNKFMYEMKTEKVILPVEEKNDLENSELCSNFQTEELHKIKDEDYDPLQSRLEYDSDSITTASIESTDLLYSTRKQRKIKKCKINEKHKSSKINTNAKEDVSIRKQSRKRKMKRPRKPLSGIVTYSKDTFEEHGVVTKCINCCKFFLTSRLQFHELSCRSMLYELEVEQLPNSVSSDRYCCFYCDEDFSEISLIESHIEKKHDKDNPFSCAICGKTFSHYTRQSAHVKSHDSNQMVACEFCGKSFTSNKIKYHMVVHDTNKYECNICGKDFLNSDRLKYHVKTHSKSYKCKYCERTFAEGHHLQNHERIHTGEEPYACYICDKKFKIRNDLLVHIAKHPNAEFKCHLCKKGFTSNEELKKHLRRHERHDYQCEYCGQLCGGMKPYKDHILIHVDPEKAEAKSLAKKERIQKLQRTNTNKYKTVRYLEKKYKCPFCDEAFHLPTALKKHLEMHNQNRPFPCNMCNKAYKVKRHLQLHIKRDHLNDNQYPCKYCGKIYKDSCARNHHVSVKHEAPEIFQKCQYCPKTFKSINSLEKHLENHNDRLVCSICGKEFKSRSTFMYHQQKHTEEEHLKIAKKLISEYTVCP